MGRNPNPEDFQIFEKKSDRKLGQISVISFLNHLKDIRSLCNEKRCISIYPRILDLNKMHGVHSFSFDKSRKKCTTTSKKCSKTGHLLHTGDSFWIIRSLFQCPAAQKSDILWSKKFKSLWPTLLLSKI